MSDKEIKAFSRKQLYDLLTKDPMIQIAKDYHLKYQDLSYKVKLKNIPIRKSGDWTYISLGYEVKREPLTGDPNEMVYIEKERNSVAGKAQNQEKLIAGKVYLLSSSGENSNWSKPENGEALKNNKTEQADGGEIVVSETIDTCSRINRSRNYVDERDSTKTLYEIFGLLPNENYFGNIGIDILGLSVRAYNSLRRGNHHTIHSVLSMTINDLTDIRNLGKASVREIIEILGDYCDKEKDNPDRLEAEAQIYNNETETEPIDLFAWLITAFQDLNYNGQKTVVDIVMTMRKIKKFSKSE